WISDLLQRLQPYSRAKALRDLQTFESVLADIKDGLEQGEATLVFETATLFSVLRSVGMIVSAWLGNPSFGRWQPIYNLRILMESHFPLRECHLRELHNARLVYARCKDHDTRLSLEECVAMQSKVAEVAAFARRFICESLH